jgi:Calx-beta domain
MNVKKFGYWLAQILAIGVVISFSPSVLATPYASCITNNSGTITFYLNEGGGNVTVTYDGGTSTDADFNGITTGTNLPAGSYSFSLGSHTDYSISVFKVGTGSPSLITNLFILGNLRGIDVNKNSTSPYFGRIYFDRSNPGFIYDLNADGSFISSNDFGGLWSTNASASSPYRMGIAPDDYLMLGDYSSIGAAVWRVSPDLSTAQLFLGPVGDTAGTTAGVHGEEFSRPVIVGSLANGGSATLYIIDGDFPSSQPNSILIYSNITLNTLPWETSPDVIGPEVGLNIQYLSNVYPGLTRGPNGYFYASEQRANWAIPDMDVYDATGTNLLWSSLPDANVNVGPDYFVTDTGHGIANAGLVDSAVSPDGQYLVGQAIDNHLTIASLTNGIPDISTIFTVVPTSYAENARGICWDAADNLYSISSGTAQVQTWTLGITATAVTTGDASGVTGFQMLYPSTVVAVSTTNTLISQSNPYGNPTSSSFTLTRTGDTSEGLVAIFSLSGTANGGADYPAAYTAGATNTVVFAPGQTSTNITITAVSDGIARPTTSLTLLLLTSPNYKVADQKMATISILNAAPDELRASVDAPSMYNAFSNDYASITVTRWGDTNAAAFTADNFTFAGTAVEGTDYTPPTPVTFNPGDTNETSYVYPLSNGQPPVHNSNAPYVGNKTAIIGLAAGSGYTVATNTAALTIIDSANPPAPVLFTDPLTNTDDATNWNITAANGDMPNTPPDYTINFGYDLLNGNQYQPIPLPPSGAATALRVTANKNDVGSSPATGVNLYLTNHIFSGDYAVRFNMNIVEGNAYASATEGPLFGINHNGTETNWWSGSTITGTVNEWPSDGIWYWISCDGDASLGDYIAFSGNGGSLPNTGWELLAQLYKSSFINAFKTNVFTVKDSDGNGIAGLPCNGSVENGENVSSWTDVEIKQINNVVTLSIDKTPIYSFVNSTVFTNGVFMLGYEDPFNGSGGEDGAAYFSNLRVVRLGPPSITEIALNNNSVVINFTSVDAEATASSFTLQTASTVTGPYTDDSSATIAQLGTEAFQVVVPMNGPQQFYRIEQN